MAAGDRRPAGVVIAADVDEVGRRRWTAGAAGTGDPGRDPPGGPRLFAERGYARTTVRDVAALAGVSAQTVYDSVGSKQALVAQLNDLIDEEAGIADIVGRALASDDPDAIVTTQARVTRAILEHCGDILRALVTGAAAEPELAEVLAEGHRRHVAGARRIARTLRERGELGEWSGPGDVAEALAAASDSSLALVLRETYGWSFDRIEAWLARSCRSFLQDRPR